MALFMLNLVLLLDSSPQERDVHYFGCRSTLGTVKVKELFFQSNQIITATSPDLCYSS